MRPKLTKDKVRRRVRNALCPLGYLDAGEIVYKQHEQVVCIVYVERAIGHATYRLDIAMSVRELCDEWPPAWPSRAGGFNIQASCLPGNNLMFTLHLLEQGVLPDDESFAVAMQELAIWVDEHVLSDEKLRRQVLDPDSYLNRRTLSNWMIQEWAGIDCSEHRAFIAHLDAENAAREAQRRARAEHQAKNLQQSDSPPTS